MKVQVYNAWTLFLYLNQMLLFLRTHSTDTVNGTLTRCATSVGWSFYSGSRSFIFWFGVVTSVTAIVRVFPTVVITPITVVGTIPSGNVFNVVSEVFVFDSQLISLFKFFTLKLQLFVSFTVLANELFVDNFQFLFRSRFSRFLFRCGFLRCRSRSLGCRCFLRSRSCSRFLFLFTRTEGRSSAPDGLSLVFSSTIS